MAESREEDIDAETERIENTLEDIKQFNERLESKGSSLGELLEESADLLKAVFGEGKEADREISFTAQEGEKAEQNPSEDAIESFAQDQERVTRETAEEERRLGAAIEDIGEATETLEIEIETLNERIKENEDRVNEMKRRIKKIEEDGLSTHRLEMLAWDLKLIAQGINLELWAHHFITEELKQVVSENQAAIRDLVVVRDDIDGLEVLDREGHEIAQEVGSRDLERAEEEEDQEIREEEQTYQQEKEAEERNIKIMEEEVEELVEELKNTETQLKQVVAQLEEVESSAKNFVNDEIQGRFEETREVIDKAEEKIDEERPEYEEIREMLNKEESEMAEV
ncbi:MAG: hypothetical protein ABEJ03_06010 [Candidatus Nanohaloarchaea archaeon]